jgi:hypothetical protein
MLDLSLKVLKEEEQKIPRKKPCFSSSQLVLPADPPTVEAELDFVFCQIRYGYRESAWEEA